MLCAFFSKRMEFLGLKEISEPLPEFVDLPLVDDVMFFPENVDTADMPVARFERLPEHTYHRYGQTHPVYRRKLTEDGVVPEGGTSPLA